MEFNFTNKNFEERKLWNYIFTETYDVEDMFRYAKEFEFLSKDSDYLDFFMLISERENDIYDRYKRKDEILEILKKLIRKEKQEIIDEFEKYKQTHHEVSASEQLKLEIIKSMLAGGTKPQEIDPDSVEDLAMKLLGVKKEKTILKINVDGENE